MSVKQGSRKLWVSGNLKPFRSIRKWHSSVKALQDINHGSYNTPSDVYRGINSTKFSSSLTDSFHRRHDYLRISLTEKCNLRCLYCMPEEGVPQSLPSKLLTTPEIYILSSIFISQGIRKLRLTGGEPTVRKDIIPLMHQIGTLRSQGLQELCITTNGISLHRKLDEMKLAGLTGINISLDTLDPWKFQIITRRKGLQAVLKSIERITEMNRLGACFKLKVNCVVMRGVNDMEIASFVELTRDQDLEVRFIEYMPFDGNKWNYEKMLSYAEMKEKIRLKYPGMMKIRDQDNDTSKTYKISGFVGKFGFITSMTHNFCGTCNRLRITSDGNLKVCLFENTEVSLRDIIRRANNGMPINETVLGVMKQRIVNKPRGLSLSKQLLGETNAEELWKTIKVAVYNKKEKHAGVKNLKSMQNRPMILIERRKAPSTVGLIQVSAALLPKLMKESLSHNQSQNKKLFFSTISESRQIELTHVTPSGSGQMVSISEKLVTRRIATAICTLFFSNDTAIPLIRSNQMKKGDVISIARIAGILAAKKTSDLIPLCHPIAITSVVIDLEIIGINNHKQDHFYVSKLSKPEIGEKSPLAASFLPGKFGGIEISVTVESDGKTGVEMEALTAASLSALTVYDMCKSVDRGMRVDGLRVVKKEGGKSGKWVEGDIKERCDP